MKTKGYPRSNPGRQSTNGRPGAHLLPWLSSTEAERHGCHGHRLEGAQAHPIGHQTLIRFFLRDLGSNTRGVTEVYLWTYSGETGPQKAVDGEAAWAAAGDGEVYPR
jgi:hypothetical protein